MTALSELVNAANTERWTHREVAEKAKAQGEKLGSDLAWKVMRGTHGVVKDPGLRALAAVFPGLTFEGLRRAADLSEEDLGPYRPPPESDRLGRRERAAVTEMIRLLAAPKAAANISFIGSAVASNEEAHFDEELNAAADGPPTPPDQGSAPDEMHET